MHGLKGSDELSGMHLFAGEGNKTRRSMIDKVYEHMIILSTKTWSDTTRK